MHLASKDNYRIKTLTSYVNAFKYSNLLLISRLDNNRLILIVRLGNYLSCTCYPYLKSCFVNVVDITVEDTIFLDSLFNALKLC